MARYFYDRYTLIQEAGYKQGSWSAPEWDFPSENDYIEGYTSYSFDKKTGLYTGTGDYQVWYRSKVHTYVYGTGGALTQWWFERDSTYYRYWREQRAVATTFYSRGPYLTTVIAEDGTYPSDGNHTDGYWYVKQGRAFPELAVKVDGQVRQATDGWVKVGGQLKQIQGIWVKVDGQLRES